MVKLNAIFLIIAIYLKHSKSVCPNYFPKRYDQAGTCGSNFDDFDIKLDTIYASGYYYTCCTDPCQYPYYPMI